MQFRKIEEHIGRETFLDDLTAPFIRNALYFDQSPSKYNVRLKHIKAALRWSYREEMIKGIDFIERLPQMRSARRSASLATKYFEAEELAALLDGMKCEKWRLLTKFLALSGLRIGEAIGLNQSDVNIETREIVVNKTYSLIMKEMSINAKTDAGNRVVYMQDERCDCVHEINRIIPHRRALFFDDNGYMKYSAYEKYFRENTEKIIGRRLTVHALRHTHVALLAAAGVDLNVISRRLGHSNSKVTNSVYMHITKRLREHDADKLRNLKILGSPNDPDDVANS